VASHSQPELARAGRDVRPFRPMGSDGSDAVLVEASMIPVIPA
jgi:hypothetical protein